MLQIHIKNNSVNLNFLSGRIEALKVFSKVRNSDNGFIRNTFLSNILIKTFKIVIWQ